MQWANFTLLPIEPPRSSQSDGEAYARRHHQFLGSPSDLDGGRASKQSFLGKSSKQDSSRPSSSSGAPGVQPRFTVILTCDQDLPLPILVKNMSERPKQVYLQMLQI